MPSGCLHRSARCRWTCESFPVGMCTRTVFAKVEIVLWRKDAETFHVEVWRSFSRYAVELLTEVAREIQVSEWPS